MLIDIFGPNPIISFIGVVFAFVVTCVSLKAFKRYLPKDIGRDFAHDGKLSADKPRGAGFIFVIVFVVTAILFSELTLEYIIYLALLIFAMLTGFFDDRSDKPWNEYKKGVLDLLVSAGTAVCFLLYNDSVITFALFGGTVVMSPIVYGVLATILVWASINVTNCSDGVDGLSGTLVIITLMTVFVMDYMQGSFLNTDYLILAFVACLLAYLWFNATPSLLMMGDAGSRAMGLFIALCVLKTGSPLIYLIVALVLILDGGLGLIKVSLKRFLKIDFMKNTRTPLHDHVRKNLGWSNTQTVFRFGIVQLLLGAVAVFFSLQA